MRANIKLNNLGRFLPGFIILCGVVPIMLVIAGCSTISVLGGRSCRADAIANKAGFEKEYIEAGNFTLLTYKKITKPGESVRIYIEGDGNAWETKRRLSDDPTPRQPIALYLASDDPSANIVYIARPGQFSQNDYMACDPAYWSSKRFSPEVIDSFNEVIDKVKTVAGAPSIELVGYSGGGAIAVLAAAKRSDVAALRTVAGNLDHKALCEYHRVSALKGSLNPIDSAAAIKKIPQRHFVGSKDSVVPAPIARSFVDRQGNGKLDRVTVVNGATHSKGWPERWKDLLILLPS